MARIHGRRGRIYMEIASGGTAEPLPFFARWSISFKTDKDEVTALGDNNKIYVAGLKDASGSFSGFFDDATAQTYTAASDGLPRKFYLYPSILTNSQYFVGTILPDMNIDGDVGASVKVSSDWAAASEMQKIG